MAPFSRKELIMMQIIGGIYYNRDRVFYINTFYINRYQYNRMLLTKLDQYNRLSNHMVSNQKNTKAPIFHIPTITGINDDIPYYDTIAEFVSEVLEHYDNNHDLTELLLTIIENYTSHNGTVLPRNDLYSNTLR